jgi:hypothetical protein
LKLDHQQSDIAITRTSLLVLLEHIIKVELQPRFQKKKNLYLQVWYEELVLCEELALVLDVVFKKCSVLWVYYDCQPTFARNCTKYLWVAFCMGNVEIIDRLSMSLRALNVWNHTYILTTGFVVS